MPATAHSEVGASGASRWINCPGSVRLCRPIPNGSSEYAREGTAAHALAELVLKGKTHDVRTLAGRYIVEEPGGDRHTVLPAELALQSKYKGRVWPIDAGMWKPVETYVDTVRKLTGMSDFMHRPPAHIVLGVETRVSLDWLHPDAFGTSDCWVLDKSARTLHVLDYKHGAGVLVGAEENPAMMYYALGLLGSPAQLAQKSVQPETVVIHIVQPRCVHAPSPHVSWEVSVAELYRWAETVLGPALRATDLPDAPLVPGDKQCLWCRAKHLCPALRHEALAAAQVDFDRFIVPKRGALPVDPATLNMEQRVQVAEMANRIRDWADAVFSALQAEAVAGKKVPGYKLVEGRGSYSWVSEERVRTELAEQFKGELYVPPALCSPAKMKEAAKRLGIDAAVLEPYIMRKPGKLVLVPEADKRQAVSSFNEMDFLDL